MSNDRLLVVDDEVSVTRVVRRIAEGMRYQCVATTDPDEFRRAICTLKPTVLVLDLNMPKVDGIQLLRDIAMEDKNASVILMSGFDARVLDAARQVGLERGLNIVATFPKPLNVERFREVLENAREVETDLMRDALAHAIGASELLLEYQPKLDGTQRRIIGFEALVRWQHPTRGMIMPDSFIGLVEGTPLIHDLTEVVAREAIGQCATWRQRGRELEIAINASAASLDRIDLPDVLRDICLAAELPTNAVIVEITESTAMREPAKTMDVLTRLRLKGFRLSLDDFGTGYSSLVQLQRLPFTELKIDKSFVMAMLKDKDCRSIVEIVLTLAEKMELKSVAEGVESAEIEDALVRLGCATLQGFHIGRPMPASVATDFLRLGPRDDSED